jgi:hypothetical protein
MIFKLDRSDAGGLLTNKGVRKEFAHSRNMDILIENRELNTVLRCGRPRGGSRVIAYLDARGRGKHFIFLFYLRSMGR